MKLTGATIAVLEVLLEAGNDGRTHGFDLMRTTGLKSGTVYPILDRLETSGLIRGEWGEPSAPGRPRRRYYTVTGGGAAELVASYARPRPVARLKPSVGIA